MFKFFLRILVFIYCFIFLFCFFVQKIGENNYVLNEDNLISSGQPWLANKFRPLNDDNSNKNEKINDNGSNKNEKINNDVIVNDVLPIIEQKISDKIFIENVPFTTQSPFTDWENSMEQDGCEEASSIMAIKWVKNEKLEKKDALDYILNISEYIENKYGEYRDVSVYDIKDWIFNDYFKYENVGVLENITKENIIGELNNNRILLIPTNGRLLENPNFVSPGPKTHMIVVLGYDIVKNIFIVNDPGTRLGENYEYDIDLLYNAIYSYPTGYHEDVDFIEKNIISVWK